MLTEAARKRGAALARDERALNAALMAAGQMPSFRAALDQPTVAVIAEVKRSSPSKGTINAGIDAATQGRAYESGGAAAISVLTEPTHFGGSPSDLMEVHAAVAIPVLKKDFHVHPLQLLEAKALGASAALLIARALSPAELISLSRDARGLELEILVEIRDEAELERAMAVDAQVIGINNRDLETLRIDPRTAERLLPRIPPEVIAVAESGMRSARDVMEAAAWGADAVLVGSFLSAAADPKAAVCELAGIPRKGRNG
jgi:indole-3-glycerol phosphate synthase